MAFSPQLNELNTVTQKEIMPDVVDNYFLAGPVTAKLKTRFNRRWAGPQIQENFLYDALRGGAYAPGGNFNLTKKQTKTGLLFTPRYYQVNVTEYLEDIEVNLAGPMAMFSTVKQDLQEAALAMSAIIEIAIFHHGQDRSGSGGEDRSLELNGLEEAFTDGTNTTWTGETFPSYGGQTRAGVGRALNTPTGQIATNQVSQASFRMLTHTYRASVIGREHPELGVTTNRAMAYLSENFLPHQIVDVKDPEINWPGLKFNQATIVESQYCPGQDGQDDANLGDYYSADGETFWWMNFGPQGDKAYLRLYIAASPKFAFGFTGFKGARDDNMLAGQILFAGNFTCRTPRLQRALWGLQN
jgi:hypothetical protein